MSDDIGSSKSFNKKFLKKKYEYEKKARRNQTKYQEKNEKDDEEDDDKDEEDNENDEDDKDNEDNNKGKGEQEEVKNKKSININTKLNSKFYSGNSEDSEEDDNEEEYQGILSKKLNNTLKKKIDSPNLGFVSGLNSPFSTTGSLNSDFGFSDNNFDFVNPESELTDQMNTEIHIHKVIRRNKANKFDTIVRGLHSLGKERVKKILSKIMGDLGIGGCIKNLKELDPEPVLYFSGNYAEKIKNILMAELDKSEDFFHTHC